MGDATISVRSARTSPELSSNAVDNAFSGGRYNIRFDDGDVILGNILRRYHSNAVPIKSGIEAYIQYSNTCLRGTEAVRQQHMQQENKGCFDE